LIHSNFGKLVDRGFALGCFLRDNVRHCHDRRHHLASSFGDEISTSLGADEIFTAGLMRAVADTVSKVVDAVLMVKPGSVVLARPEASPLERSRLLGRPLASVLDG